MKVKEIINKKEEDFKPIELKIIIETMSEAKLLWCIFNMSDNMRDRVVESSCHNTYEFLKAPITHDTISAVDEIFDVIDTMLEKRRLK